VALSEWFPIGSVAVAPVEDHERLRDGCGIAGDGAPLGGGQVDGLVGCRVVFGQRRSAGSQAPMFDDLAVRRVRELGTGRWLRRSSTRWSPSRTARVGTTRLRAPSGLTASGA